MSPTKNLHCEWGNILQHLPYAPGKTFFPESEVCAAHGQTKTREYNVRFSRVPVSPRDKPHRPAPSSTCCQPWHCQHRVPVRKVSLKAMWTLLFHMNIPDNKKTGLSSTLYHTDFPCIYFFFFLFYFLSLKFNSLLLQSMFLRIVTFDLHQAVEKGA